MKNIRRLLVVSLIIVDAITLAPVGASAEWRHDSKGNWYTEGDSYAIGWRKIEHFGGSSWSLFGEDGYAKTGWFQDGGNWYYADSMSNFISTDCYVDGYYLNSDGVLSSDTSNARTKESSVKATLDIAKKLENSGWVKEGTYWNDSAKLTPKTDSEYTSYNTGCLINSGIAKIIGVSKLQTYEEWDRSSDRPCIDCTLDEYLKYKSEGRIGSFTYQHGMSDPLKYTTIQEYLRNEPVPTKDTSVSTNESTSGKWHSSDYSKYRTLSEKNQENQNKN